MEYYLESHLPHALQFMRCRQNAEGATDDVTYPEDVVVVIPAGTDPKHVAKITEEQREFLLKDKEFNKLVRLNKFGVRWVDRMPTRMLSDNERMDELKRKINEQGAEIARLKAGH